MSNANRPDRGRRAFLMTVAAAGSAALVGIEPSASAQGAAQPVSTSDPLAKSLGYVESAGSVDKAKFPTYKAGQECSKCRFYTGAAGDAQGPCQIFAGKLVKSAGWCSSFVTK